MPISPKREEEDDTRNDGCREEEDRFDEVNAGGRGDTAVDGRVNDFV